MLTQNVEVVVPLEPARQPVPATVEVRELASGRRAFRGARTWVLCWIAAAACVPIPILHFILVPGFLILGPILGWRASRATSLVVGGSFRCARCSAEQSIGTPEVAWPAEVSCSDCGVGLELRKAAPAAAALTS